jgi:hypothetical protein
VHEKTMITLLLIGDDHLLRQGLRNWNSHEQAHFAGD